MKKVIKLIIKGLKCWKQNGFEYTVGRIQRKWKQYRVRRKMGQEVVFSDEELGRQRKTEFKENIKISILTPLYNTPEVFLREMIESVQAQTYGNWELCLCDGSDLEHQNVGKLCEEASVADSRIKYKKLKKNSGISENTNKCIDLASGSYFALLDHDDVLHPSALYEVMKKICDEKADLIYTDEAKFTTNIEKFFDPNFKPDYAKDELRAHNYVCHLTVYSRELLEKVGHYDPNCDGSQDHDIVLRMTEQAEHIVHIPKILYFWRVHRESVSAGVEVKSYAISAAHLAVKAQLDRCEETGTVSSIYPYQSLYRVKYELKKTPLVAVIIYGVSEREDFLRCVKSMEDMTIYYPMKLYVVEGKMDRAVFQHVMKSIPTVKPVEVIYREEDTDEIEMLNLAVQRCNDAEYIVFLRADMMIDSKHWVTEMLMFAQREDVGVVGGKIYDGNRAIYSAGIALDQDDPSLIHQMYFGEPWGSHGYEAGLCHVRNVTAVSGLLLMVSKKVFEDVGGLNSSCGKYCFIDLCLRIRKRDFLNVWTPFVEAIYWGKCEAYSREERDTFAKLWKKELNVCDPYYNPNIRKYMIF